MEERIRKLEMQVEYLQGIVETLSTETQYLMGLAEKPTKYFNTIIKSPNLEWMDSDERN